MKWIFLLPFIFSSVFAADSCSNRINQNEAVNLENARSQDSVGWCYAYAASELVSFRLKQRVSAVSLYSSRKPNTKNDEIMPVEDDVQASAGLGGDMSFAINHYLKKNKGFCTEEELPSDDFLFCQMNNYNQFLNQFITSVKDDKFMNDQCLQSSFYSAFPQLSFKDAQKIIASNGKEKIIEKLMDESCKKLIGKNSKLAALNMMLPYKSKQLQLEKIDDLINSGEISGLMVDYTKLTGDATRNGDHAMVVVGRRRNPASGQCEYLLRNSFGKECNMAETTNLSCHKNCDKNECRYSGHLWVSKTLMEKAMFGITYLQ